MRDTSLLILGSNPPHWCFSVAHLHTNVYEVCTWSVVVVESSLGQRRKIILELSSAILLCTVATGILGTAFSMLQASRTVPNSGSVKGVGVGIYWDSECTNRTSSISWGILDPGSNKTINVYVRNEGNAVATLSKTAQNWNPSNASSYMSLTWNYANQTLSINQVFQVSLTLAVSSNVTGISNFNFDITIVATG